VPAPAFVVDASVVVRWLVDGPHKDACDQFLERCGLLDARLLAPTCLYSEVSNALYRMCLAPPSDASLTPSGAMRLFRSLPDYELALVDYVRRLASGELALTPQWEQLSDSTIRDYRTEIYARGVELSYPSRRGSLFDMAYAALAEQAGTTMWTIDERFYNGARAQGLAFVMHPGIDPLP
jgi:predicted nucleic acid-binding protein